MPGNRTAHSPAQIAIALLLVCLLGYKLSVAAREGLAELYATPAIDLMDTWADAEAELFESSENDQNGEETAELAVFVPNADEWQAVLQNLQSAATLAPGNPAHHASLGRLYQFKLDDESLDIPDLEIVIDKALDYFQQAAYLRPTWSYHWWDIALTEYEAYRYHTDTYHRALSNTATFGPWLSDTQLFVTDLTLDTWASLDQQTQQTALANIDRALIRQPDETIELIESYEGWNTICEFVIATNPSIIARSKATSPVPYPNLNANCPQAALLTDIQLAPQPSNN